MELFDDLKIGAIMKSVQKAVTDCATLCGKYKDTFSKYPIFI